jgi:hypothetical protein
MPRGPKAKASQRSRRAAFSLTAQVPQMPKKPAQPCDLRIAYAGNVFLLAPLSRRGREWLAEAVECDGAGPVEVSLQHLDAVVSEARRGAVVLDTPWDPDDAGN